jgi:hypothetical protein
VSNGYDREGAGDTEVRLCAPLLVNRAPAPKPKSLTLGQKPSDNLTAAHSDTQLHYAKRYSKTGFSNRRAG